MNQKTRTIHENFAVQLIRSSNRCGSHEGCVRVWRGCKYTHELVKFQICFKLINDGWKVFTEAIFLNGSRCDIFAVNGFSAYIIEVLESEKEADCDRKKYPVGIEVMKVKCKDFKLEEFQI